MTNKLFTATALALLLAGRWLAQPAVGASASSFENDFELVVSGDFDGDGLQDIAILDKSSGKYRLGYQDAAGAFTWINFRVSGLPNLASATTGRLLTTNCDALVLVSTDTASLAGSQVIIVDASSRQVVLAAKSLPFAKLGPSAVAAVDAGSDQPLDHLYIGCRYETPPKAFWLRNDGGKFPIITAEELPGEPVSAMRCARKAGQPDLVGVLLKTADETSFRLEEASAGSIRPLATAELPADAQCVLGHFRGGPWPELVSYRSNESQLVVHPLEQTPQGTIRFGTNATVHAVKPIKFAVAVPQGDGAKLLLSFGAGDAAELCDFDGVHAPKSILSLTPKATNEVFSAAVALPGVLMVLCAPRHAKPMFSTSYQLIHWPGGRPAVKAYGALPTLIQSDDGTVPQIHQRILASLDVQRPSQMRAYTNAIPGSDVTFVMVPIPGGEFLMGSPHKEKGRQPDEGPRHKVILEPFWMGACEVTWNEYEIFMSTNIELNLRASFPVDTYVNKLSDAVSRPSCPYADMTFGMGKRGYPAISMTQHAANKYCHWLSAKTGQFYRLPTEAEWEYAARAGATNAYFFGDDPKALAEYAWFGKNSDWKYQKIGKKKPNPWGLYDIYGNVVEWCLDQYKPDYYNEFANKLAVEPWSKAAKPYPHVVRGGCWDDDDPAKCRSAARRGSDRSWKMQDPQLPKSVWYFTDAKWVGFRLVRPLKVPSAEELKKYWISGVEKD